FRTSEPEPHIGSEQQPALVPEPVAYYSQRAAVRAALAQDPSWISEYICKALPLLTAQDNEVSYLVPWSRLKSPPQQGGVFELATFRMRPGGPAVWGGAFQAAMSAHDAPGYGKLLGAFHSEFGLLNRVHALWWFESADHRAECRHKAHTDARVVAAVRNSVAHLDSQRNQLMFPCTFSPMK
uniref:NIPSNAP domain-containing protein n=1 Tax=Xiphophorus couchianus TaxID=32473 RepID=A0A3B5M793_9TELE